MGAKTESSPIETGLRLSWDVTHHENKIG